MTYNKQVVRNGKVRKCLAVVDCWPQKYLLNFNLCLGEIYIFPSAELKARCWNRKWQGCAKIHNSILWRSGHWSQVPKLCRRRRVFWCIPTVSIYYGPLIALQLLTLSVSYRWRLPKFLVLHQSRTAQECCSLCFSTLVCGDVDLDSVLRAEWWQKNEFAKVMHPISLNN